MFSVPHGLEMDVGRKEEREGKIGIDGRNDFLNNYLRGCDTAREGSRPYDQVIQSLLTMNHYTNQQPPIGQMTWKPVMSRAVPYLPY